MPSSPQALGERAFKRFVKGLHQNQGQAPAPWFLAGYVYASRYPALDVAVPRRSGLRGVVCRAGVGRAAVVTRKAMDKIAYGGGLGFLLADYSRSCGA